MRFSRLPLAVVILLSVLGCQHPRLRVPAVTPAPRTWGEQDYRVPREGGDAQTAESLPRISYPTERERRVEQRQGLVLAEQRWSALEELHSEVRVVGSADAAWAGLPGPGSPVVTRVSVWPRGFTTDLLLEVRAAARRSVPLPIRR